MYPLHPICRIAAVVTLACVGVVASAQSPSTASSAHRFDAVDAVIDNAAADAGAAFPFALQVYDQQDRLVYARAIGDFAPERRVPVASASKLVAGIMLLSLVDTGTLSLETTTRQSLGWTGAKGEITLRQLLGQVSGLKAEVPCLNDIRTSLAACVDSIRDDEAALQDPPGTQFNYGGGHFQVAARMAEVATGKTWHALFADLLGKPLGLPAETNFYTSPWFGLAQAGTSNPRVAGGMVASMQDFARLLAVPFHRGQFAGRSFGARQLFDEMGTEPNPAAAVRSSPMVSISRLPFRYGLGAWTECRPAVPRCQVLSSAGAFGWTPWLDRDAGYYAIIGMYRLPTSPLAVPGIVDFSVQLQQRLRPLLTQAMRSQ